MLLGLLPGSDYPIIRQTTDASIIVSERHPDFSIKSFAADCPSSKIGE